VCVCVFVCVCVCACVFLTGVLFVQEFFAYGMMNFVGSFFGSFATAGALSRSILQDTTGGNTQVNSVHHT